MIDQSKNREYISRIASKFNASHDFIFGNGIIGLSYVGSHSHNTYIPPTDPEAIDDIDFMGVILPSSKYVLGLHQFEHWTYQGQDELDVTLYSFHKFMHLLLKSNPNVLGLLWMEPEMILLDSQPWATLVENRNLFATKAAAEPFLGYAASQMGRMVGYTPAIHHHMLALEDDLAKAGWSLENVMGNRRVAMPVGISVEDANAKADELRKLRARYHAAYMGDKRRNLVLKYGYDTKNAAHLVRLLKMCKGFMDTGYMQVFRTVDADEIRDIKTGKWALEDVKSYAEQLFADAKVARDSSPLPPRPDFDAVSELTADIARSYLMY